MRLWSNLRLAFPFLLLTTALLNTRAGAQDKPISELTKLDSRKLVALDTDLREAFARTGGDKLPETKRKPLPGADAASFDWARYLGAPLVYDQAGKRDCAAQATVAALEWNWQIRNGGKTKPLLSPQPILDRLQQNEFRPHEPVSALLAHGTATLQDYPYTGEPGPLRTEVATPYRIVGWGFVVPSLEPDLDKIKQALLDHGPLVAGIYATPAFKAYKGGVFKEHFREIPKDKPANHAVVIVGWDDRRGKGCWHVQNSCGLRWGEGGGAWVEYGCNNVGIACFWLRAQSVHYDLPADAHQLLGEKAAPFHTWATGSREAEAALLSVELLRATGSRQDRLLEKLKESKGGAYTGALAGAIPKLTGTPKSKARDALAERLARMTAETVSEKLRDEDLEIRRAAALACAMREEKTHIPRLIELLKDPEPPVARAARAALKDLTGQDFGPPADASAADRDRAVTAWEAWWQKNKGR
jgi:hypothetical protein